MDSAEWRESENNRRAKYWTGSGKGMSNQEVRDALGAEDPIAGAVAVPQERDG